MKPYCVVLLVEWYSRGFELPLLAFHLLPITYQRQGAVIGFQCISINRLSLSSSSSAPSAFRKDLVLRSILTPALFLTQGEIVREMSLGRARAAQRCFNCGSYNHAMGECPQPRDAEAISAGLAGMRAAGLVDGERPASRCASASFRFQALMHTGLPAAVLPPPGCSRFSTVSS